MEGIRVLKPIVGGLEVGFLADGDVAFARAMQILGVGQR